MQTIYDELLKTWCDAMVKHQITSIKSRGLYGGILCPSCSMVHGRSADAVYPLMHLAHITKESRYLDAAVLLQDWAEHLSCPDGSWVNEVESGWKGITVFGAIALGEAIRNHGSILDLKILEQWKKRLHKATEYLYDNFDITTGNINYPVSCSAAMAIAAEIFDEPRYRIKGHDLAHESLEYFTDNKILFGEGRPQNGKTNRGCRPVDLGYNVEESLPALVLYGLLTGDEEVLETVTESLIQHLEFMLPDGAWDNSWGSRSYKWTYWGSRTSDGCQSAYALLSDRDPRFAEAAYRNAQLLKECTHDGLLHGGLHYKIKGELPCMHHTFCHSKTMATVLDHKAQAHRNSTPVSLPREADTGVRYYPEIDTWLVAKGPWRATVTSNDWEYFKGSHPSGGALSLLWHNDLRTVLSGSLNEYWLVEGINQQRHRDEIDMPLTPSFEYLENGIYYRSINDLNASVTCTEAADAIGFSISGRLVDKESKSPASGEIRYDIAYEFTNNCVAMKVNINYDTKIGNVRYYLPIISDQTETIESLNEGSCMVCKKNGKLSVAANGLKILDCEKQRIFNHVPGFQAVPFYIELQQGEAVEIRLSVV